MGVMIRIALFLVALAASLLPRAGWETAAAAQREACAATAANGAPAPRCRERRVRGARPLPTWRETAIDDDRRRLRLWREAFVEALAEARAAGHGAAIAREGALLDPDAAIRGATLPQGEYRCRTLKLGSRGVEGLAFVDYPAFRCRVAPGPDGLMHFTRFGGSQRPVGRLFAEHDLRQIFLGALQLGDERTALRYGRDRERNMAGVVERIGERRWRIVFPYPHFESIADVVELSYLPPESR
jgi:hypothetical protein